MNPSLSDTLISFGISPRKIPTEPAIGKFYRDGAYWLKILSFNVAVFGNWATGEKGEWFAEKPTDKTELARRHKEAKVAQAQAHREQVKQWEEGALRARRCWFNSCIAVDNYHLYLHKKQLKPYGLRQYNGSLVVPVYSIIDNKTKSLQLIESNGSKRFLTGCKMAGGYFVSRRYKADEQIVIAEGWATSQSLAQQWHIDGWHVCAFNSGNLINVAKALRKRHPFEQIIIAADNDVSGAGQIAATQAAKAIGASVTMPTFTDDERAKFGKVSDWQDRWAIDQLNIKEVARYAD